MLFFTRHNSEKVIADAGRLKEFFLSDHEAFKLMGLLYGYDIISPRQLAVLKEEWLHSQNTGFQQKNVWTFLAATMLCLKSSPPITIMQKHFQAYEMFVPSNNKLKWLDIDPNYKFHLDPGKT